MKIGCRLHRKISQGRKGARQAWKGASQASGKEISQVRKGARPASGKERSFSQSAAAPAQDSLPVNIESATQVKPGLH